MTSMKNSALILFLFISTVHAQSVLPTDAQLKWADAEIGVLIHFDMPVFEPSYDFRNDWSYHPSLSVFNPTQLDTDQWIKASKAAYYFPLHRYRPFSNLNI